MKVCNTCNIKKSLNEFHIGYLKCKKCRYETAKIYRKTSAGILARKKEIIKDKLSGKHKERQKKYKNTLKGKIATSKYEYKRYNTVEGKAKMAAKNAVRYALKKGKLIKQPCFICGNNMSEAHHSSYDKDMKLIVTWLCSTHHNYIHNPLGTIC